MKIFQNIATVLATAGLLSGADACLRVTAKYDVAADRVYDLQMIDNGVPMCYSFSTGLNFNNAAGVRALSCNINTNWVANLVKIGATADEGFRIEVLDRSGPRRFKFPLVKTCVDGSTSCQVADLTANEYGC